MRRVLALTAVSSVLALGLAASTAPAARAASMPLALGGCMETPLPLSDTAAIARTCASWDGTNLALWVEGSGLAQEFTAIGSANFNLFGYLLTIEARAGMRAAPFGGWEAFVELTRPFAWGPLTVPLQVAEDGSRVTLWLSTAGLSAKNLGNSTDGASSNSFSLTFLGADGTPRGSVVVPMALSSVAPPALPAPDLHPSAPGAQPVPPAEPAPGAVTTSTPQTSSAAPASAHTSIGGATATRSSTGSVTRVTAERAALGRY